MADVFYLKMCHNYHEGENMENLDIYRCDTCGNIVQTLVTGGGELVCCGHAMQKLEPKTTEDAIMEKHVPVFVKQDDGTTEIRVGEVLHPMLPEHYIMFVETISKDKNSLHLQYLHPSDEPKMRIKDDIDGLKALEYCNIHGLWSTK